ncbi:hypothetical protein PTTG_27932 [Puccinia triticina 1-1 BBBD Race 1]|uniref:Uncharacterized protein n=2 Tax=Puccinia triticina TaxID=208348 RepID=A0A180GFL5_PUCT1|nr:uncharacterized protein PtA15_3A834 [Puccinia triticina]OAV91516.1 hypothetical protein PTTG_27932 [Puccinia triticina 1-1 BBBD Race 1]WAQ83463.1 hypothetical protein PtA15_3A834 [Puccinia triticina]WAR54300.1 hypothetical protein PtB15_3B814 [Puccinia triticina]
MPLNLAYLGLVLLLGSFMDIETRAMPFQRVSCPDETPGALPMPSQFASHESAVEHNPPPKLAVPAPVQKKNVDPAPPSTPDADSGSHTFDPPRIEKAAKAAMEPLGTFNRAQNNNILDAPINLLSGKDLIPDFGFVNNKNIDGQLRKVTYGVDDKGNIVEHSAQVVNSH